VCVYVPTMKEEKPEVLNKMWEPKILQLKLH